MIENDLDFDLDEVIAQENEAARTMEEDKIREIGELLGNLHPNWYGYALYYLYGRAESSRQQPLIDALYDALRSATKAAAEADEKEAEKEE